MMVAIPEIDGAIWPMTFGGRARPRRLPGCAATLRRPGKPRHGACIERVAMLAARVAKLVALRRTRARGAQASRIVLFNFPPNAGAVGTAAYLAVFASLHNTLHALAAPGLRRRRCRRASTTCARRCSAATPRQFGTAGQRRRPHSGRRRIVLRDPHGSPRSRRSGGRRPAGTRPTAAASSCSARASATSSSACSRPSASRATRCACCSSAASRPPTPSAPSTAGCARISRADAAAAFRHARRAGIHARQAGRHVGANCWPDRLIGDLPNFYLYAANNPSEGTLAKRRAGAALVSYLTPPLAQAGLYGPAGAQGQRSTAGARCPTMPRQRVELARLIQATRPRRSTCAGGRLDRDRRLDLAGLLEIEIRADPPRPACRRRAARPATPLTEHAGAMPGDAPTLRERGALDALLAEDAEIPAILHALGRPLHPAGAGRRPDPQHRHPADRPQPAWLRSLPHAQRLRACRRARGRRRSCSTRTPTAGMLPETVAMVLWGTDNLKTEGGPIAQALALMGAAPRFDSYGRLGGAELVPLAELGPPAHRRGGDAVRHLPRPAAAADQAAGRGRLLAATADEPLEQNFVRKPTRSPNAERWACDIETAACASSAMPRAPTAPTSTSSSAAASGTTRTSSPTPIRRARASPTACNGKAAQQPRAAAGRAGRRRTHLPEPRSRRARRHHRRPLLRHARRHQPRRAPRPRRRRPRSISATRPAAKARCAPSPNRWRWRPAPAR